MSEIIPAAALSQHIAIVGRTGSGKTYSAKAAIVEPLLAAGKRVCILDPTGAWFGLKSSADGKHAGFPVVIIGGEHADLPLDEGSGAALAELIANSNMPCIIDLSDFGVGERNRFAAAFAEALLRKNRAPLHLIIDEADEFLPQSGGKEKNVDANVMLNRFDRIVRRGRRLGFRCVLISQRPAVLNKNALTQCGTLIAMRLPAPQDRKAIEDWIHGQADESHAREVLGSLASLKRGEGWLWFPEGGVLKRVQMPSIRTFDSSASPDDGVTVAQPKVLAEVDLAYIGLTLRAAVERAEADDPVKLREQIKNLRAEIADHKAAVERAKAGQKPAEPPVDVKALTESAVAHGHARGYAEACRVLLPLCRSADEATKALHAKLEHGQALEIPPLAPSGKVVTAGVDVQRDRTVVSTVRHSGQFAELRKSPNGHQLAPSGTGLSGPEQRILDALAELHAIGVDEPENEQVAFLAGYSHLNSKGYANGRGALKSRGYIDYPGPGRMRITPQGRDSARPVGRPLSNADLQDRVCALLGGASEKILRPLISIYPQSMAREELAAKAGYGHLNSKGFANAIGRMRTLGFISYPDRGTVRAHSVLFPVQS